MSKGLCTADGCLNEAQRNGKCWAHDRAARDGRQVTQRAKPEQAWDLMSEAAIAYADADDEDHEEFDLAKAKLRMYARRYAQRAQAEAIRAGMARAKASGKHVGRPRKASKDDQEIADVVAALKSVRRAADAMGLSRWAVTRALRRVRAGGGAKGPLPRT